MAASAKIYSKFPFWLLGDQFGEFTDVDKFKCMLCTSIYTPNQDDHDAKDDITNEVVGDGYVAGGEGLGVHGKSVAGRVTKFDGADVEWADSTITARYAVVYDNDPVGDDNKMLVFYVDFGENKSSEAGTFKIQWNASGIFTITVPA